MVVKNYLPIGSVVLIKESKKRLMIYGRKKIVKSENKEYDYLACPYPEGDLGTGKAFLFNHEDIHMVYFIGFQDVDELYYRKLLRKSDKDKGEMKDASDSNKE